MKISIITVVRNGEKYIKDCIESVISQTYPNIEYIVIDGKSTDGTLGIIEKYKSHIHQFISEKDRGMYDALNKGIAMATGAIIGILNADDTLASPNVISDIAVCFEANHPDAVYGNLNYVDPITNRIIRRWVSKPYTKKKIRLGWMPAHPTLYLKKETFAQFGNYSLNYGTAADYELMLRFLYRHQIKAAFLDQLIVNMRTGGMSNASFKQRYSALLNDYKAIRSNQIPFGLLTLLFKKLGKLSQFFVLVNLFNILLIINLTFGHTINKLWIFYKGI